MADNTTAGGVAVATRSVTYSGDAAQNAQVVGLVTFSGADDAKTATDIPAGSGTEATALRVTIATDSTGVLSVDDNGSTLTVDAPVGTPVFVRLSDGSAAADLTVADNGPFTDGTTKVVAAGYIYDEVAGTALTENDAAAARINVNRAQVATIEDGATRGRYATVTATNALKVDASGVAVPVTDNASSLTVDAPVGTPVFVRLSDGAAAITNLAINIAQVGGNTVSTAASGVQKVGIVGNAGATVDSTAAAGTAPTNAVLVGQVYNATIPAPTDGQALAQQADQSGNTRIFDGIGIATLSAWTSATGLNATQNIFTNSGAEAVMVHLVQTTTISAGAITFEVSYDNTNWVAIPADAVIDPASTTVAQISLPYTLQASTNKPFLLMSKGWRGLRIKLSTAITGTGSVTPNYALLPFAPADTVVALSPTSANFKTEPNGGIAHDSPDSTSNPIKVGGRASNALATATMVASADRTDFITDLDGVLITKPFCPIANIIRHHGSVTATTSTAATNFSAVASTRNMITSIIVHNSSATDTFVELQDGSGGTTFCVIPAPKGGGAVVTFPVPLPQPTANLGLFFKENSAATTVYVTIVGFQTKAG